MLLARGLGANAFGLVPANIDILSLKSQLTRVILNTAGRDCIIDEHGMEEEKVKIQLMK